MARAVPNCPPVPRIVKKGAMKWWPRGKRLQMGNRARSAARSPEYGPLPHLSISLVHASPQSNVPELAGYVRDIGCDVSIIVVESANRGSYDSVTRTHFTMQ